MCVTLKKIDSRSTYSKPTDSESLFESTTMSIRPAGFLVFCPCKLYAQSTGRYFTDDLMMMNLVHMVELPYGQSLVKTVRIAPYLNIAPNKLLSEIESLRT